MLDFITYMPEVFTAWNFTILVLGTVGGLILGATPGLSPTMAVALLIPFTFHMQPATGLILLGAAYTSTVAGGAISAILLSIPGAPSNIATTLDGHPLAKQGRATAELHYCFISSLVGGVLGVCGAGCLSVWRLVWVGVSFLVCVGFSLARSLARLGL